MNTSEGVKPTPEQIVRDLNSNSVLKVWEAAKATHHHSRTTSHFGKELLALLKEGKRPSYRSAAAYALGSGNHKKAIPALEAALASRKENPYVRGYAAEALANLSSNRSIPLLTKCLADPSKIVRFWCIYALGVAGTLDRRRAKIAVPPLREIAESDKRMIPGYWLVKDEARWALAEIEGRTKDAKKIGRQLWARLKSAKSRRK